MFKQLKLPDAWSFDQDWVPICHVSYGCVLLCIALKKKRQFFNVGCFFIYLSDGNHGDMQQKKTCSVSRAQNTTSCEGHIELIFHDMF